jgi:hypothetical protein
MNQEGSLCCPLFFRVAERNELDSAVVQTK